MPFFLLLILFSSQSTAADKWKLWVQGPHLRGANIWQVTPEGQAETELPWKTHVGPPYELSDFEKLSQWGANYVNLSVPGLYAERAPYGLDLRVQEHLDMLLDKALKADLFAVISFRTGPGRNEQGFTKNDRKFHRVWKNRHAQDAWVKMWQYTASRYANQPHVAGYDLMVEPNANAVYFNLWDPEEFYSMYKGSTFDWNVLMRRLHAAIREVDNETPILVNVPSYGSIAWLDTVDVVSDPKTVYVIHHYEPFEYTHQKVPLVLKYPNTKMNSGSMREKFAKIDAFKNKTGSPVSSNEYGVMRYQPGAAEYLKDMLDLFEEKGMNHAIWLWESSFQGVDWDDFNFRHGPDIQHHSEVPTSVFLETLKLFWARNSIRPSTIHSKSERYLRGSNRSKVSAKETVLSATASGLQKQKVGTRMESGTKQSFLPSKKNH